ncbi:MAG TPA: glycoside hydrolase family 3 N-terminal domain-containing protein [Gemmatimonadaceae bacterium]|nr:glycoside hydrolase family 3 N-terminal domain-containing protein [Gemmatimonadaceae bacterium]
MIRKATFLFLSVVIGACAPAATHRQAATGLPQPAARLIGEAKPGASTPLSADDTRWVEETLRSLSLREKVAQLIMPWVPGEYAAVGSPGYEQFRKWVQEERVGGVVMSIGLPLNYAAKLNHMQRISKIPLLVASDMENGTGMRLANIYAFPSLLPQGGGTVFPPVMALGATRSEDLAFKLGQVLGTEARAVGVHINFGPVLDVNSNPLNPIINTRSFGEDPALVAKLADAYIRGARSSGLMTTGKHFPGHGDTDTDSHLELPAVRGDRKHLDAIDLPPFRAAVLEGIDGIMTAHIAATGILGADAPPATLAPYFMTDVLRKEMSFDGLLFTDAMTMGGVAKRYGATEPLVLALEAGADVLLMPRSVEDAISTVMAALNSGRLKESRIDQSVRRILLAKARAGLRTGRLVDLERVDEVVNVPANAAVAQQVAERSITLARDTKGLVPLNAGVHRILSITYADASDPIASREFNNELRSAGYTVVTASADDRTTPDEYQSMLKRAADSADVVIASAYVSPREFSGSVSTKGGFSSFMNSLAATGKPLVAISFGSPYLLSAFPDVPAYLLAWGGAPLSQRSAAAALLGRIAITGKLPVSLPPYNAIGSGIERQAIRAAAK